MKELNLDLLKALYCVFSPSNGEKKMRRFIKRHIKNNIPTAIVTQDVHGNLFVTKGEAESYPCLCAHMDQVQDLHPTDFVCIEDQGVIFGYSPKLHKQCGLGADDKNGIFIALQCLERYDVLKCAFFVGEEIGCVGSHAADIEFFADCRFCAQIDRRGNSDMVTSISFGNICSDEFVTAADCETYGYAVSTGLMTDVEALRDNGVTASCINMSCGYYEPHTDHEFTVLKDVKKCHAFVCHLIEHCTSVYAHKEDDYEYNSNSSEWRRSEWENDEWNRYDYCDFYDECLEYCSNWLRDDPQLSLDEFIDAAQMYFPFSKSGFAEIFENASDYVKSEIV